MKFKFPLTVLVISITLMSCEKDIGSDDGSGNTSYEQLLNDEYDYVIQPTLSQLESKLSDLKTASTNFISNYNQSNYDDLVEKFDSAYLAYQLAGPNTAFFKTGINDLFNRFRIDTTIAKDLIDNNTYSLASESNEKANGFPMLDYLLFFSSNPVTYFQADSKRGSYVDTLVGYMYAQMKVISTTAASSKSSFVSSGGTNKGSSISSQLNKLLDFYEAGIREDKVGIHIGLEGPNDSRNTNPDSTDIEAQFRNYADGDQAFAISLLKRSIQGIENSYLCRGLDNSDNYGYDDVLQKLDKNDIDTDIKQQFQDIYTKIASKTQLNDYTDVTLYNEVQELVTLFKSDLLPALNVTDDDELGNDGD